MPHEDEQMGNWLLSRVPPSNRRPTGFSRPRTRLRGVTVRERCPPGPSFSVASRVTSDASPILVRELNERLGFGEMISQTLRDSLRGKDAQLPLAAVFR